MVPQRPGEEARSAGPRFKETGGEKQAAQARKEVSKRCKGRKNTVWQPEQHRIDLKMPICEVRLLTSQREDRKVLEEEHGSLEQVRQ